MLSLFWLNIYLSACHLQQAVLEAAAKELPGVSEAQGSGLINTKLTPFLLQLLTKVLPSFG